MNITILSKHSLKKLSKHVLKNVINHGDRNENVTVTKLFLKYTVNKTQGKGVASCYSSEIMRNDIFHVNLFTILKGLGDTRLDHKLKGV
jgi:hypothetical protein